MSLVVSDSSPLNLLASLGHTDLLVALFARVIVPTAVAEELSHPHAPTPARDLFRVPPPWLEVRSPAHLLPLERLDPGERAAISLAVELSAPLLIDERDGRREAAALGLDIIGVVGILERAADKGLIADLAEVHNRLRAQKFHVSEPILRESLERHRQSARLKEGRDTDCDK